ncbi:hypothetical protein [Actibacterium mucosum]|uniref:hypothetical protein n=1 Tax=Actibacterium mucosum TaxID=1087332 RepID=UPI0012678F1A|nr:hypothetical protein [Actibacterium mucosum]
MPLCRNYSCPWVNFRAAVPQDLQILRHLQSHPPVNRLQTATNAIFEAAAMAKTCQNALFLSGGDVPLCYNGPRKTHVMEQNNGQVAKI